MKTDAITCPQCKTAILAERRRGRTGPVSRAVDRVVYVQVDDDRAVVILCPQCNEPVRWKGKRLLIVDAA